MNNKLIIKFKSLYNSNPIGYSSAPGRVNLIGEFTDYNLGYVLPCALTFRTKILFKIRNDDKIIVHSMQYPNEKDEFSISKSITPGLCQWGNYIRSMVFILGKEGYNLSGLELLIDSDVPQGAGLSSSAALEVAIGGVFNFVGNLSLSTQQIAILGQQAENQFMQCHCGIMDQLISAEGKANHALLIDCRDLSTIPINIPEDLSLVIINSNYQRKLVESEYNSRREDCEQAAKVLNVTSLRDVTMADLQGAKNSLSKNQFKRAHHVVSENARVLESIEALKDNNIKKLNQLMSASHYSLKHDFEVTVPATDGLVQICEAALEGRGAVRMTGGGFGGAVICLCRCDDIEIIKLAVEKSYYTQFSLHASIYVCQAGGGLIVEKLPIINIEN